MPKSPPPRDDDDARAFEEAMRGARRIAGGARRVTGAPTRASPSPSAKARAAAASAGGRAPFAVESVGDAVAGRAADVSAEVLRALRRGDHRPESRLDLHGQTREESLRSVERFLLRARADGHRTVLVIHGRGQNSDAGEPVLRPAVQEWLARAAAARSGERACPPAPAPAGGTGATLVLLRR